MYYTCIKFLSSLPAILVKARKMPLRALNLLQSAWEALQSYDKHKYSLK